MKMSSLIPSLNPRVVSFLLSMILWAAPAPRPVLADRLPDCPCHVFPAPFACQTRGDCGGDTNQDNEGRTDDGSGENRHPGHQKTNTVVLATVHPGGDDLGGWYYHNDPTDVLYGRVEANCSHGDHKGIPWASY